MLSALGHTNISGSSVKYMTLTARISVRLAKNTDKFSRNWKVMEQQLTRPTHQTIIRDKHIQPHAVCMRNMGTDKYYRTDCTVYGLSDHLMFLGLVHFRTSVTLRRVMVRVRVGLELRLGLWLFCSTAGFVYMM